MVLYWKTETWARVNGAIKDRVAKDNRKRRKRRGGCLQFVLAKIYIRVSELN